MTVEYKPGRENVLAEALSRRRHDTALSVMTTVHSDLYDRIRRGYKHDPALRSIRDVLASPTPSGIAQIERYSIRDGLLYYHHALDVAARIAVPCDAALRTEITQEFHDTPGTGHLGFEKTFLAIGHLF